MAVTRADGGEFEMSSPDNPDDDITFSEEGMDVSEDILEHLPDLADGIEGDEEES